MASERNRPRLGGDEQPLRGGPRIIPGMKAGPGGPEGRVGG